MKLKDTYTYYDRYYTIEAYGPKGWEVIWSSFDSADAISRFEKGVKESDGTQYRLTAPTTQFLLEKM